MKKQKESTIEHPFWLDNPKILIAEVSQLYPKKTYTDVQNLNAITRLFILIGLIVYIYTSKIQHLLFSCLTGFLLTYVIYTGLPEGFMSSSSKGEPTCQLPSKENPFANMIPGDPVNRLPACDQEDPKVKTMTDYYFKLGLYRDVNDVWDKNNSQQIFNTKPNTQLPNDRDKWAKWCFNSPSCRDGDTDYCLQYNSILTP